MLTGIRSVVWTTATLWPASVSKCTSVPVAEMFSEHRSGQNHHGVTDPGLDRATAYRRELRREQGRAGEQEAKCRGKGHGGKVGQTAHDGACTDQPTEGQQAAQQREKDSKQPANQGFTHVSQRVKQSLRQRLGSIGFFFWATQFGHHR